MLVLIRIVLARSALRVMEYILRCSRREELRLVITLLLGSSQTLYIDGDSCRYYEKKMSREGRRQNFYGHEEKRLHCSRHCVETIGTTHNAPGQCEPMAKNNEDDAE